MKNVRLTVVEGVRLVEVRRYTPVVVARFTPVKVRGSMPVTAYTQDIDTIYAEYAERCICADLDEHWENVIDGLNEVFSSRGLDYCSLKGVRLG